MKEEILLGDTVQDIHTGFTGVAMIKSEFFNGCIQYDVLPRAKKDNVPVESTGIDSQSLKLIKKGPRHKKAVEEEESTGGPNHRGISMRGY